MKHAFSLVELSIVLVILGLLTGGILAGQNLIRAAELRSVSTDFDKYRTASMTFRDKYFALPGDMTNATAFWGSAGGTGDDTACFQATTADATCNGNGDGHWSDPSASILIVSYFEGLTVWEHLSRAGLIEGSYTGYGADGVDKKHVAGENAPPSKLSSAAWTAANAGLITNAVILNQNSGQRINALVIGATGVLEAKYPLLSPGESWSIDTKLDDGRPGSGMVRAPANNKPYYTNCATSADGTTAEYNVTYESAACPVIFLLK